LVYKVLSVHERRTRPVIVQV